MTLVLFPNFGGEEPGSVERALRVPAMARLAELWSELFPVGAALDVAGAGFEANSGASRTGPPREMPFEQMRDFLGGSDDGLAAWYPNDAARRRADERSIPLVGPSVETVARLHDKKFSVETSRPHLPAKLAACISTFEPEELTDEGATEQIESRVADWPAPFRRQFTLKPRIGTSGRGRVMGVDGKLPESSRRGLRTLAGKSGAVLEPWLERVCDYSTQLWISRSGEIELLGTTIQHLSESGQYRGTRGIVSSSGSSLRLPDEERPLDEEIRQAACRIGEVAAAEGFFGPCGVDSFSYRDPLSDPRPGSVRGSRPDPCIELRAIVELNARFTTGTIALGQLRIHSAGAEPDSEWRFQL